MAHIEFGDIRVEKSVVITVGLQMGPEGESVVSVVHHDDTVGVDSPLLLEVLPDVLAPLSVLLELVAGPDLKRFLVDGADHPSHVGVVLDPRISLEPLVHLVGEGAVGHQDKGHVALLVLPSVVQPGDPAESKVESSH